MKRALLLSISMFVFACGGGSDKPAENASNGGGGAGDCPQGMVKQGGDCVAPEGESGPGKAASMESHGSGSSTGGTSTTATMTNTSTGTSTSTTPAQEKTAYDRDSVELVLKRAAAMVKSSCGAATDESGKASGPWGNTKASVRLGRNGHVRGVDVPAPYGDKPVGTCVVHAFQNLIFPPYAAPADVTVDWDVEIVKPK
jgi:hypothetical protein